MIKLLGTNSICFIGKIYELKWQLSAIEDKSISLAEYIKKQTERYKSSLN